MSRQDPAGASTDDAPAGYTPTQRMSWYARQHHIRASEHLAIARDAAIAEAEYRNARALVARSEIVKGAPIGKAEIFADADAFVHSACLAYKVGDAKREASRIKIRQLETAIEACRTEIATEREQDRLTAAGADGTA